MTWWERLAGLRRANRRPSAGERPGYRTDPDQQEHEPAEQAADHEHHDTDAGPTAEAAQLDQHGNQKKAEERGHGDDRRVVPDQPQITDEDRTVLNHVLVAAHGARSLLVTGLVAIMVLVSIVAAPPADLAWHRTALAYAGLALLAFLWSRLAACGGIVPIGTHGDSRFVIAVIGTFFITATSAETAALLPAPFFLLVLAAGLCGMADGAWTATAMRHLRLPFFRAFATLWWPPRAHEACTWRIVASGPGRDAP